jgi:hypothetical protein
MFSKSQLKNKGQAKCKSCTDGITISSGLADAAAELVRHYTLLLNALLLGNSNIFACRNVKLCTLTKMKHWSTFLTFKRLKDLPRQRLSVSYSRLALSWLNWNDSNTTWRSNACKRRSRLDSVPLPRSDCKRKPRKRSVLGDSKTSANMMSWFVNSVKPWKTRSDDEGTLSSPHASNVSAHNWKLVNERRTKRENYSKSNFNTKPFFDNNVMLWMRLIDSGARSSMRVLARKKKTEN